MLPLGRGRAPGVVNSVLAELGAAKTTDAAGVSWLRATAGGRSSSVSLMTVRSARHQLHRSVRGRDQNAAAVDGRARRDRLLGFVDQIPGSAGADAQEPPAPGA